MKNVTFRLAAYSAAAGKYDPNAPNAGNEDNFYVDDNLGDDEVNHIIADQPVVLSDCGALLVVADGMGGMNAGEVASEIAVNTVRQYFSPGKVTPAMARDAQSRQRYMESVIVAADENIKQEARNNSSHDGMGSTIIMAWIAGDEVTVSWCGDSRCYRFNPLKGIEMLSHDHSYVQELADKGIITYEQTFCHPQGNIVMRSLGDESHKAQPETKNYKLYRNDIIMLCSDGLSGVLFDRQCYMDNVLLSNENLEDIIRANQHSMQACREALFTAAERADWYDNVTVLLCKMCDGLDPMPASTYQPREHEEENASPNPRVGRSTFINFRVKKKTLVLIIVALVVLIAGGVTAALLTKNRDMERFEEKLEEAEETIPGSMDSARGTDENPEPEASGLGQGNASSNKPKEKGNNSFEKLKEEPLKDVKPDKDSTPSQNPIKELNKKLQKQTEGTGLGSPNSNGGSNHSEITN